MADTQSTIGSVGSGAASGFAIGGPWGAAIGGVAGLVGSLLNRQKSPKPVTLPPWQNIPGYQTTDIEKETQRALDASRAQEGDIEALLARANKFNQGQASGLMEQAVPGWGKLSQKFLQTADSLVTNPYDIPADVQANLVRQAAERGISSGARGQFSQFSLLRDLGINSLNYGQSRINQAQGLLQLIGGLSPRVSPLSPMAFYTTPNVAIDVATRNAYGVNSVNQFNAMGRQGVLNANQGVNQGAANAATAADNWNTNNRWKNIADFVSLIPTMIPKGSGGAGAGTGGGGSVPVASGAYGMG